MEHPPLTQKQIETLHEVSAGAQEYTIAEMTSRDLKLGYLEQCGYLTSVQTATNPNPELVRYRYTRTSKPIA